MPTACSNVRLSDTPSHGQNSRRWSSSRASISSYVSLPFSRSPKPASVEYTRPASSSDTRRSNRPCSKYHTRFDSGENIASLLTSANQRPDPTQSRPALPLVKLAHGPTNHRRPMHPRTLTLRQHLLKLPDTRIIFRRHRVYVPRGRTHTHLNHHPHDRTISPNNHMRGGHTPK